LLNDPYNTISVTDLPNAFHKGKVRDTYELGKDHLLMIATDRISAFDVVLPSAIPQKGAVLSRISDYWFQATSHIVPNHMVSLVDRLGKDQALWPTVPFEQISDGLASRSMIVRKASRIDIECVVRGYITGSALSEYRDAGTVAGREMPTGLRDGDALPEILFTPTTKAETGHDLPMTIEEVQEMVGMDMATRLESISKEIYRFAHDTLKNNGIIIADTKMEFGIIDSELTLIDELLTPDSSRFWDAELYEPGKSQPNFDKQYVRDWLSASGWDREPPAPELPDSVISNTEARYIQAYEIITGRNWKNVTGNKT